MIDKKSIESRRKLLKSIAAGSGAIVAGKSLPDSWSRPVVDSVLLPAHAMTSLTESSGPAGDIQNAKLETDSLFAKAIDSLVPEAQAIGATILDSQVCVTQTDTNTGKFEAWVVYQECGIYTVYYSASNVKAGVPTEMNIKYLCNEQATDVGDILNKIGLIKDAQAGTESQVTIETFSGSKGGAKGEFDDNESTGIIPFDLALGSCKPFVPQCPNNIQTLCV
jgi:hypothetical protein